MSQSHVLFTAVPAWGHVRPFCILATRLVNDNANVVVTMIIAPSLLDKAHSEISAEIRDEAMLRRIRVVATFKPTEEIASSKDDAVALIRPLAETFPAAYEAIAQGKSITCAVTGTLFDGVPPPSVAILDFFAFPQFQAIRAITGRSVPVFGWATGHASATIRAFGPESIGGMGDLGSKIEAEVARTGLTPDVVGVKIYTHTEGKVVNIAGLPPMYDHEFFPQNLPFALPISELMKGVNEFFRDCEGIILTSAYAFESVSLAATRSWFADWKKDTYVIGPLLPFGYEKNAQGSRGGVEIEAFLDKALVEHGQKSVLLISFGTLFWPTVPEYVDELIETLVEKNFPFIFCVASPFAKVSDELTQKVKSSGLGLLTRWAPQQFVLTHPATGWFLTHCGHNGVIESLAAGIPLIAWPFEADQPAAAAHVTENLNVAFELIEVRTGEDGMKPLLRNGRAAKGTREAVGLEFREVFDACRGQKGEEKRRNAEEMKAKLAEPWQQDGTSRKEMRAFFGRYI